MVTSTEKCLRVLLLAAVVFFAAQSHARAQSAWGGGCTGTNPLKSCVYLLWPTLYGFYEVTGFIPGEENGHIAISVVYLCVTGAACTPKGSFDMYFGESPHVSLDVSGAGSAYFRVDVYQRFTHNYMGSLYSPMQYWDEDI